MYTVKYIDENDIEEVGKGKLKINGSWVTIWKDSLGDLFVDLRKYKTDPVDVACIDVLTIKAHSLTAMYV